MTIVLSESNSKGKKSTEELEQLMQQKLQALQIDTKKDLALFDAGSNYKNYFLRSQDINKTKIYTLLVRDAVTVGKVAIALESAGISNISISRTEYSKSEEIKLQLKSLAVARAKEQAEYLTRPLGQKPGKAIHITDSLNFSPNQAREERIILRGAGSISGNTDYPIDIDFMKIKIQSLVNVKFELQ